MADRVTAPLVIAKDKDGVPFYFYEGAVLPDNITADERKRLKADGMIEGDKDDKGDTAKPAEAKKPTPN